MTTKIAATCSKSRTTVIALKLGIPLLAILACLAPSAHAQTNVVIPWTTSHIQFLDATGDPLAAGCIYVYSAGTTSPAPTYTDSQGSVQNANPVILDSGGFATIWLGTLSYKFIAYSMGTGGTLGTNCYSGTQQWSVDNIPGAGTSSGSIAFSSLTAATNANAGTFATTGNTWDFTAATAVKVPNSAGFAPTASASIGYDTTANKWVFGQNGAAKNFGIASTAACSAGQFVSTPATATAAASCSAPSLTGSTCTNCTINGSSTFTGSITSATMASSTISASTLSGTITNSGTISGGTIASPTITSPTINTGISNGTGFQMATAAIGNIGNGGLDTITINWSVTWGDTDYLPVCQITNLGNTMNALPYIYDVRSLGTTSMLVDIFNNGFAGTTSGTLVCIAVHN